MEKSFPQTYHKSFCPLFSKSGAVEGAEPSSRSAEREIILGVSFLITFFFAPLASKKKVANKFVHFDELLFL